MRPFIALFALALVILILVFPQTAMDSASAAMQLWIGVLVPCLMPYCAAAAMLVKSGVMSRLSRPLGKVTRRVTGFSGCFSYVLITSLLSGYPNGARLCGELFARGELCEDEAARMINATSLCGPSFIISAACSGMLGDISLAKYILIPHYLSAAVIVLLSRPRLKYNNAVQLSSRPCAGSWELIADSVGVSAAAMLNILGFTVLFSVVCGLIAGLFPAFFSAHPVLRALLGGFMEMTAGCERAASLPSETALALMSFFVSFGGLSVICQTVSTAREYKLKTQRLFASKLLQGGLSAAFTFAYTKLFAPEVRAFSAVGSSRLSPVPLIFAFLSLAVICAAALICRRFRR